MAYQPTNLPSNQAKPSQANQGEGRAPATFAFCYA